MEKSSLIDKQAISLSPEAVLCQGEMTMTMALIQLFQKNEIPVYAATSVRKSIEEQHSDDTSEKKSIFQFVQFRQYPSL